MKNLLNLKGAQQLSKQEQKSVNGGVTKRPPFCQNHLCPPDYCCGSDPYFCVLSVNGGANCR
ncbi:hypothetical protein [Aquimarina megaterium]|uniref:hypothetical protein n=1 Tax=Aquimarina megaterium TaxID=1443666 RepID=UPI0004701910|nr:hypothetical protein [Aquimarina megaterium]